MPCCTARKRKPGATRVTKEPASAPMPRMACAGTSPCARASASCMPDKTKQVQDLTDQLERIRASIRAKVEHPFRGIKRQFGQVEVRYRGLNKSTAQQHTLFALSNLWMAAAFDGSAGMSAPATIRINGEQVERCPAPPA